MYDLAVRLSKEGVNGVRRDERLASHSSWGIGGPADFFAEPSSADQIATCVRLAPKYGVPLTVIGHGTNLLFADEGLRSLVIKLGPAFGRVLFKDTSIVADAGAWVPGLAFQAMRHGLTGLEHTIGIPGTLGGLVVMNGGSRRNGIGSVVRRVSLVSRSGELQTLSQSECEFAYRSSVLQRNGGIVCAVELELSRAAIHAVRSECLSILRDRRRKFPRKDRSCGSVFLSAPTFYAEHGPPGKLIEDVGLKGFRIGDAEVSVRHANFIVNKGRATARDILAVIEHVREAVRREFDVVLQCEVQRVLENGSVVAAP